MTQNSFFLFIFANPIALLHIKYSTYMIQRVIDEKYIRAFHKMNSHNISSIIFCEGRHIWSLQTMKLLLLCIFIIKSTAIFAQDLYTIKGYVKDGTTYDPWGPQMFSIHRNNLSGARITIDNKIDYYTDYNGGFVIAGLPNGKHKLKISYSGYYPVTYTVSKEDSLIFLLHNKNYLAGADGVLFMGQHPALKGINDEKEEVVYIIKDWLNGNIHVQGDSRVRKACKYYNKGKTYYDVDRKKAIKYFYKAANYNHPDASYELGKIYEEGEDGGHGIDSRISEALRHYYNSANHGNIEAQKRIDVIEGRSISNAITSELGKLKPIHGNRVALIIGNYRYNNKEELPNVNNDTKMLWKELEDSLNFKVLIKPNRNRDDMEREIKDFCNIISDSCEAALFFYSGHGLYAEQTNYLQPIDANLERTSDEVDIQSKCISLDYVIKKMARSSAKTKIIMVDACRENEFIGLDKGVCTSNIKPIEPPRDFFISFATMIGEVAKDGDLHHSPYMEAIIEALRVPGLPLNDVFYRAKTGTNILSKGKQSPCIIDTTTGIPFFFNNKIIQ